MNKRAPAVCAATPYLFYKSLCHCERSFLLQNFICFNLPLCYSQQVSSLFQSRLLTRDRRKVFSVTNLRFLRSAVAVSPQVTGIGWRTFRVCRRPTTTRDAGERVHDGGIAPCPFIGGTRSAEVLLYESVISIFMVYQD